MGNIYLLDCTLRDGGYVNDWRFGRNAIRGIASGMERTGVEIFEVGFLKGDTYDPDRAVFPDIGSITGVITPKSSEMKYVAMLDMSAPIPIERIPAYDGSSVDGIRVIFKKDRIREAYEYCSRIQELGYFISVNFVGTDQYSDSEFIDGIELFNTLDPYAVSIVDSFGVIKRKQFLRLVYIADNNLKDSIALAYHAHNNLQQAFGNAEALVELNLKRDIIIDACVFGMGRGAGNLNLELFAEYLNENYDTDYRIDPMLEIMDKYLSEIYRDRFWGYSLPLYLSASNACHPNYAIYYAEKDSLNSRDFDRLLKSIPADERALFSRERAEKYYRAYVGERIDDTDAVSRIRTALAGRRVVVIAPGHSIVEREEELSAMCSSGDHVCICVNFEPERYTPDYVFCNNSRRLERMNITDTGRLIVTSNLREDVSSELIVNYSDHAGDVPEIMDNSALMLLRFLASIGVSEADIYGMDGYSDYYGKDYYEHGLEYSFSSGASERNRMIGGELRKIKKDMKLNFITPTHYDTGA